MVWTDKLKLNKQIVRSLTDTGYVLPKEIQLKTLTRISGGQDIIAIGPEGCGKTTTCILSALNKFRQGFDDAPRVLILVPAKEQVLNLLDQFKVLNKNKTIKVVGLYAASGMEEQLDALADGADIVVSTPDRARAIYLKLALNLNKIQLLVLDDADLIVKQGLQLPVTELANSIPKCQHIVFTEVMHGKLSSMLQPFISNPATIEVELNSDAKLITHEQVLYHVPNFGTKINLLNLFLEDEELFTKVMVIVNTPSTLEKIYHNCYRSVKPQTMLFKHQADEAITANNISEFITTRYRILLAVNGDVELSDTDEVPIIIHFELPEDKESYISRIVNHEPGKQEKIAITFATDLELNMISKIEHATGAKIPVADLPNDLKMETGHVKSTKAVFEESPSGVAFHPKKPANAKTYNYSSGVKAKMSKKKKHG
ncbi:MAG TPA: DEAD/DEAH box helicase [Sphingobacteriaceae bacterium]|nr:DEAD/DEAH box helicase [Sphingobacteriaceae bacterium]